MFAKIRSSTFIDALQLEFSAARGHFLKAILRDDKGSICSVMEKNLTADKEQLVWSGLNDLPYGRYTLELSQGEEELTMDLVKRV